MSDSVKRKLSLVVIPVLSSVLTVLLIIPGYQGENLLSHVIAVLKGLAGV